MSKEHFVVIGNGPAGNEAALTLREKAPDDRITLISRNRGSCYCPRLLPDLIAGKIPEDTIYACPLETYRNAGVKLRTGQEVVDVDLNRREILLDHREIISFTGLVIAVGGKPRIPESLFIFRDLLLTLKTLEDAAAWIEKLSGVDSVLMVGGDLTSLAVTRALLHLGKRVYFMLNEDAFWPLRCDDAIMEDVSRRLAAKGVEVLRDRQLKGMARRSEKTIQVYLDSQSIQAGMIGAFFGLVPDVRFLARSGLPIDRGILVDETLNAGFEGVYATGDCAQIYHPEIRDYWVSIGHDNAVTLGRTAALNLLGARVRAEVDAENILEIQGIKVNTSWWTEF
jgi:NAD(P)H-nitrite reductase large subunit